MADLKTPEVPFRKLITNVWGDTKINTFFGEKTKYLSEKVTEYQYFDKEKGWVEFPTEYDYKEINFK